MKISRNHYVLLGWMCMILFSCKEIPHSVYPRIDLAEYSKHQWTIWGDGKHYSGLGSVYLHKTSDITPNDVKDIKIYQQKVFLLTSTGSLMRFDLRSGQKESHYREKIHSFDIDTVHQHVYALAEGQKSIYKYDFQKDSLLSVKDLEHTGHEYDGCLYLSEGNLLFPTNNYPNGIYVVVNTNTGKLRSFQSIPMRISQYVSLPDTFQLKSYVTGVSERGVLYKHLLNDTIFVWDKERFIPFAISYTNGEGIAHKEATFFQKEQLFINNQMLAMMHLDKVNDVWLVNYKHKYQRKDKEWYSVASALLNEDFSVREMDDYIFCLEKKKIVVNPHYPYYVDKERKGLYQLYRKEAHPNDAMGQTVEVFEHMANHADPNDLILCFFNI